MDKKSVYNVKITRQILMQFYLVTQLNWFYETLWRHERISWTRLAARILFSPRHSL